MAKKLLLILVVVSFAFTGCASLTWNAAVTETGSPKYLEDEALKAGTKIAEYRIILNMFETGRATFDGLVIAEARKGKKIHILQVNQVFVTTITAYAENDR